MFFLAFLTKSDFRNTNTEDILQSKTCCGLKVKMSFLAEILGENLHSRGKQKLPPIAVIANSKNKQRKNMISFLTNIYVKRQFSDNHLPQSTTHTTLRWKLRTDPKMQQRYFSSICRLRKKKKRFIGFFLGSQWNINVLPCDADVRWCWLWNRYF